MIPGWMVATGWLIEPTIIVLGIVLVYFVTRSVMLRWWPHLW